MTTTTTQCTQPGCGGTIEDGYCTVCGMAAAPASAAPASAAPASAAPAAPATCTQPGCGGTVEDGYCTVCGMAAAPAPVPVTAADQRTGLVPGLGGHRRQYGHARQRGTRGTHGSTGRSSRGNLGAGLVEIPPVPAHDPASAILADPQVPESRRFCPNCEQPVGRARDGRPGLAEGFCRNCGTPFLLHPEAAGRGSGRRPVRGARLPGPRWARLDLPGQGPQRQRQLAGAQGPAQHRRRGRHGGRGGGAAVPGRRRPSQHRPDLQLRPAHRSQQRRDGRIHRDGVRRRPLAPADPARRAEGWPVGTGRARARLRDRGAARTRLPAQPRAGLLRLQAGQRDPVGRDAQAHRHGRRAPDRRRGQPHLRDGRLPGPGDRGRRALPLLRPVHGRARPGGAHLRVHRVHQHLSAHASRSRHRAAARAAGVVLPAAAPGHQPRSRPPVRLGGRHGRAAHRRLARGARGR